MLDDVEVAFLAHDVTDLFVIDGHEIVFVMQEIPSLRVGVAAVPRKRLEYARDGGRFPRC